MVGGHRFEDAAEKRPGFQRVMVRNRDVMGAIDAGGEPNVGAILPDLFVTEHPQRTDEVRSADVSGNFQTASASSRTK